MTTPVVQEGKVQSSRKRAADFTGKQTERLQQERKAEIQEVATRVALATAAAEEEKNIVVDYTGSDEPIPEVELRKVEVSTPYRMIRVNQDIDQMTYGRRVTDPGNPDANPPVPPRTELNMLSFKEGVVYRVDKEVADHLNSLGYLTYMGGA